MNEAKAPPRPTAADRADRRLGAGLLVSVALHGLILLFQFGVPGIGLPGAAPPLTVTVRLADPVTPPVPDPVADAAAAAPPLAPAKPAASGMRLVDPAPPPPVALAKPAVKKDKPRRARRISPPMPARETVDMAERVITQDAVKSDFAVPLARPEEAEVRTADLKEAQHGDNDGTAASNAAAEAEAARAGQARAVAEEEARRLARELERKEEEQARVAALEVQQRQAAQAEKEQQLAAAAEQQRRAELEKADQLLAEQRKAQQIAQQVRLEQQQAEQLRSEQLRAEQELLEKQRLERQRAEQLRAEQQRAEQLRAEQQRSEQARAEQLRAEQQRAEQTRLEQARTEQIRAEQARAEQAKAEQARVEQAKAEQARAEQQAAQQRARDLAATQPGSAAPSGRPAGAGGAGGSAPQIPKNLLGSELANRARDMVRGIDVLSGAPPAPRMGSRRAVVGAAERDISLKMYVESWRQKIERNGGVNYPRSWADMVRIDPLVSVAVRSDGTVEEVTIVRSSGRADMDNAVERIIRINARYSAFPPNIAEKYDVIEIRRVWSFGDVLRLMEEVR